MALESPPEHLAVKSSLFVGGPIEQDINHIARHHAGSNHGASGDRPPQNVRAGELPDGEQAGNHRDQNARTRSPERNLSHGTRVDEALFSSALC